MALPPMIALLKRTCVDGTQYACPVRVKTPCLVRPAAWFVLHRTALLAAADAIYTLRRVDNPIPALMSIGSEACGMLFDRVVAAYMDLATSGGLVMTLRQGCCAQFRTCSFSNYMHSVLVAVRTKVRDEEEALPRDF